MGRKTPSVRLCGIVSLLQNAENSKWKLLDKRGWFFKDSCQYGTRFFKNIFKISLDFLNSMCYSMFVKIVDK